MRVGMPAAPDSNRGRSSKLSMKLGDFLFQLSNALFQTDDFLALFVETRSQLPVRGVQPVHESIDIDLTITQILLQFGGGVHTDML